MNRHDLVKILDISKDQEGNQILTIRTKEEIPNYIFNRYKSDAGELLGELTLFDKRNITAAQRDKIYAMFRDIADAQQENKEDVKYNMKKGYCKWRGVPFFSLSSRKSECSIEQAKDFIGYILDVIQIRQIPTRRSIVELSEDLPRSMYQCLMVGECAVCRALDSEIEHVDAVGAGRNRRKIDHTKHRLMRLCRKHHKERHQMGIESFCNFYHVEGVRVTDRDLKIIFNKKMRIEGIDDYLEYVKYCEKLEE